MIRLPPSRFQPSRPNRNARRYSTTWTPGSRLRGTRASVTWPCLTTHPFATRTVPPTAAMRRPSRKGRVSRSRASGSISVSASTAITSGKRLALIAALSESAFPPFPLSIPTSLVRAAGRYRAQRRQRAVLRPVVDDHHLVVAVMQRQDRRDAGFDGLLLVVRGDQDRDGRKGIALHQPLEVIVFREPRLLPDLGYRENQEQRVERVERQEVHEDREVRVADEPAHAANSASAWGESPSTRRAMSRALGSAPTSAASSALRPAEPKRVRASPVRIRTHQSGSRSAACNSGSEIGRASGRA